MFNLRSATYVTRALLTLAVLKLSLVVSQDTTTLQEDNYDKVPCDFENGLCDWTNLNHATMWTRTYYCREEGLWWWSHCTEAVHYLQLHVNQLQNNGNSTLISPPLVPRSNVRCTLSFLYRCECDNRACHLSVDWQTHRGVEQLWNVTTNSNIVKTAHVDVPCSDIEYEILIVGRKLGGNLCSYLDVDNIKFDLTTIPTTIEDSTFSSLSRRVSLTSFTSLEATPPPSSTPGGTGSFTITPLSTTNSSVTEPLPNSDNQNSDDEGLGTGPVVAIVIVIVIVVVAIVVIVVIVVRRRNGAEKQNRTTGPAGSTSPGNSNVGGIGGHDNLVYSANRLEMDTIPPMSGNATNPENTPDYYNVSGLNSLETPPATAQDDVYENTRTPPPDEEYAVVDNNGKTKQTEEEAAAAGTSDYEPVAVDSGMAASRPELPSDMYNKLGDKGKAGMQLEPPQTHYDHLSGPDGDYSGLDLEDKIRDQQRAAVADQYSHI